MAKRPKKGKARKTVDSTVWTSPNAPGWKVVFGHLKPGRGRPERVERLLTIVAEKVPFGALSLVAKKVGNQEGVYVAHDSMGYARYIGRGEIFKRLRSRRRARPLELAYFSFYVVQAKKHEREIETLLIRAAGPLLQFNERKKQVGIDPGDVGDFEPGTKFFERQRKKGRRPAK